MILGWGEVLTTRLVRKAVFGMMAMRRMSALPKPPPSQLALDVEQYRKDAEEVRSAVA